MKVISFLSGVLFAVGLGIAGMTQPAKVKAFLDVAGAWDPSLALVMVGAIAVYTLAWRLRRRWSAPLLARQWVLPTRRDIDAPLLAGAALFGVGWGLGGFCPGPGLTALASGAAPALVFSAALIGGMILQGQAERILRRGPLPGPVKES